MDEHDNLTRKLEDLQNKEKTLSIGTKAKEKITQFSFEMLLEEYWKFYFEE